MDLSSRGDRIGAGEHFAGPSQKKNYADLPMLVNLQVVVCVFSTAPPHQSK